MSSVLNRREVLAGLGAAAARSAAVPAIAAADASSVRGAWLIQPATGRGRASFRALAGRRVIREYAVIYEQGKEGWVAWVLVLSGCVAVGDIREEVERLIREAIEAHIERLREHGEPVPEPSSTVGAVRGAVLSAGWR